MPNFAQTQYVTSGAQRSALQMISYHHAQEQLTDNSLEDPQELATTVAYTITDYL